MFNYLARKAEQQQQKNKNNCIQFVHFADMCFLIHIYIHLYFSTHIHTQFNIGTTFFTDQINLTTI